MFSKVQGRYSRVQVLTQECKHPPRTLNFDTCSEIVKHNQAFLRRKRLPPLVRVSLSVRTGTSELARVRLCADWRRCPRKGAEARDGPADSISFQVIGVVFLNVKTDFLNLEIVFSKFRIRFSKFRIGFASTCFRFTKLWRSVFSLETSANLGGFTKNLPGFTKTFPRKF